MYSTNVGRYKPKTNKHRSVQTSNQEKRQISTNVRQYKRRTRNKRQTSTNVGLRKKIIWILRIKKSYFILLTGLIRIFPKLLSSLSSLTQTFSSLYLFNLVMVLTFDTFKLKLLDLLDFIGWNIKGYTTSGCKDTSEYVTIELKSFLVWCFNQWYLQRMRLYSVVWFFHNKWVILNLFLIAMVFFSNSTKVRRFSL